MTTPQPTIDDGDPEADACVRPAGRARVLLRTARVLVELGLSILGVTLGLALAVVVALAAAGLDDHAATVSSAATWVAVFGAALVGAGAVLAVPTGAVVAWSTLRRQR